MLTELTSEQTVLMRKVREFWIDAALDNPKRVQVADIKEPIKYIYKKVGRAAPRIFIFDSPLAQRQAIAKHIGRKHNEISTQFFGLGWEAWVALYDFFEQIGIVKSEDFKIWKSFLLTGVWDAWFDNDTVFVCRTPLSVIRDERGRLHNLTGPAVEWGDGVKHWFIEGVNFSEDLWRKLIDRTLDATSAVGIPNLEQRRIAIRLIGYQKVVEKLGARTIDIQSLTHPKLRGMNYQVIEANLKDDGDRPARFVKVICPSTKREFLLRVAPIDQTKTCMGAIAWTFGMEEKEYNPIIET